MGFHHFVRGNLKRSEKVQQWVVQALLNSELPNDKRESSIEWELKHSSGVIQMARLLADKRGLDTEIAEVAAALHDIYVILKGRYANHAKLGMDLAKNILEEIGGFTEAEVKLITEAIGNHSDKHLYSDNPYVELVKDADALDCFLYGDGIYDEKPDDVKKHYFRRIILLRRELGLKDKKFHLEKLKRLGGHV